MENMTSRSSSKKMCAGVVCLMIIVILLANTANSAVYNHGTKIYVNSKSLMKVENMDFFNRSGGYLAIQQNSYFLASANIINEGLISIQDSSRLKSNNNLYNVDRMQNDNTINLGLIVIKNIVNSGFIRNIGIIQIGD